MLQPRQTELSGPRGLTRYLWRAVASPGAALLLSEVLEVRVCRVLESWCELLAGQLELYWGFLYRPVRSCRAFLQIPK